MPGLRVVAVGAAVLATVVLAAFLVAWGHGPSPRIAPLAVGPGASSTASAAPAPEPHGATSFETTPSHAEIWWDGKRLDRGERVPTDGRTHTLRVAAPGYEAVDRTVVADRPQSFVVSLSALPAPSASATAPRQHAPPQRVAEGRHETVPPERASSRAPAPGERAAAPPPAIIDDPNGL
jgi:hypothetical protein